MFKNCCVFVNYFLFSQLTDRNWDTIVLICSYVRYHFRVSAQNIAFHIYHIFKRNDIVWRMVTESRCFIFFHFFMESRRPFSKRLLSQPCKTGKSKNKSPLSIENTYLGVLTFSLGRETSAMCTWSLRLNDSSKILQKCF